MAKGYWMSAYREVKDPEKLAAYAAIAAEAVKAHGGRFLARGGRMEPKEFAVDARTVLVEFESSERAQETYASEKYQEALQVLGNAVVRDFRIVEGVE